MPSLSRLDAAGGQRLVVPLVGVPALGRDEDVLPVQAGLGDRLADRALVAVRRRGVDMAVADLERGRDGGPGLVLGHQEDAEADLRDLRAVAEAEVWNGGHRQN